MRRGQSSGRRGRGNFKGNNSGNHERESALQRLGKVVYPKAANLNERALSKKYKFVRNSGVKFSVVPLPAEQRLKTLTTKFIKSYYEAFDQAGRQNLESLYSPDAFFSFSATHPMPTTGRNLLEVQEPQQRLSMLMHGKTNIAQALAMFSPTEHIENCQTIDIPYFISNPLSISSIHAVVTGLFNDTSQQTNSLKAFTRVFVLKLISIDSTGEPIYQIFNDIFMLQAPTADQIKKFHQEQQALKRLSSEKLTTNSSASGLQTLRTREETLIKSIMSRTRMNRAGSTKLLEESNWDEDKSLGIFNNLYSQNKIPQEFFTQ